MPTSPSGRGRLVARLRTRSDGVQQHLGDLIADRVHGIERLLGFWNTAAISAPRRRRYSRAGSVRRSRPSNDNEP